MDGQIIRLTERQQMMDKSKYVIKVVKSLNQLKIKDEM